MKTHDDEDKVLRDGQRMRVPVMLRDNAPARVTIADQQRSEQRGISVSQAQYENRLSDFWRNPPAEQGQAAAPVQPQITDNGQNAYEQRLRDAYRGSSNV